MFQMRSLDPGCLHAREPRPTILNLEHMHRDFGTQQPLLARQIHWRGETGNMRHWAVTRRTLPAAYLLGTRFRVAALLESFDADIAELVVAGADASCCFLWSVSK